MSEIHCHNCGGFITDPTNVSYGLPPEGTAPAGPRSARCTCRAPILYGPPLAYLAWPGLRSIERSTAAARN